MNLISVPYGRGGLGKTEGTEKGFPKILEEFRQLYISNDGEGHHESVSELKVDTLNHENNISLLGEELKKLSMIKPIFIGGDHSISYPLIKHFSQKSSRELALIVFDAHPDLEQVEKGFEATHDNYLRTLIEQNILKKENIFIIGIKNWTAEEFTYIKRLGIKHLTSTQIDEMELDQIMESFIGKDLYVSLDIDAIDPIFAPGTHYKVAGGFTSNQIIKIMRKLSFFKDLIAIDIVEYNSDLDVDNNTSRLIAKILMELKI